MYVHLYCSLTVYGVFMIGSLCNWQVPGKSAVLDKMKLMGLTQKMMGNQCVRNKLRFAFVNYALWLTLKYLNFVNGRFSAFHVIFTKYLMVSKAHRYNTQNDISRI